MHTARLREFLDSEHVKYHLLSHPTAFTAQEVAFRSHVAQQELAKTVIVKIDGDLVMAVLPATSHVDLGLIRRHTEAETVRLASEFEFKSRFPDCEIGAMPPFGNLYGLQVFVDESLTKDKEIAFNACSHEELVRMSYADFERLSKPTVLKFAAQPAHAPAGLDDRFW